MELRHLCFTPVFKRKLKTFYAPSVDCRGSRRARKTVYIVLYCSFIIVGP